MNLEVKIAILKCFRNQADFATAAGERECKVSRVIHGRQMLSEEHARIWQKLLGCKASILEPVTAPGKAICKRCGTSR